MNARILIVAAREFRQIATTRSFWLTLLILPLALAIGPITQRFMNKDDPDRIMIVDRTPGGAVTRAIERRFAIEHGRETMVALSRLVQRERLERADPAAPWATHDRWYADAEVARFLARGGLANALTRIRAVSPAAATGFEAPKADQRIVAVPARIAATPDARLDASLQPLLRPAGKEKALDYALLIPASFGADPAVRLWSNGTASPRFVAGLQDVLTGALRQRFLEQQGLSATTATTAQAIAPALTVTTPPRGGGTRERMLIRSVLPMAASYMLMMSLLLSGSWMLQGTVEERSNKLVETVLACVSPEELMIGKLLGLVGIGLSMIAVWVGCGLVVAFATQGAIADFVRPALEPLRSPGTVAAMLYFFVAGYLSSSVLFLAIGVMSDSMRDAQGYLTPLILVLMLPIFVLIQAVISGGGGIGVEVLTWVPIWTPFAVLARLGLGIPTWEVVAVGVLLAAFVALELSLLGRIFRNSLLSAGEKPSLKGLLRRLRSDEAGFASR